MPDKLHPLAPVASHKPATLNRTLVPGSPARMRPVPPVVRDLEAGLVSLEAWLRPQRARLAS